MILQYRSPGNGPVSIFHLEGVAEAVAAGVAVQEKEATAAVDGTALGED